MNVKKGKGRSITIKGGDMEDNSHSLIDEGQSSTLCKHSMDSGMAMFSILPQKNGPIR